MAPQGLRIRFARVRGVTTKGVLTRAIVLPVALGDFSVDEAANHGDYSTVADGDYSVPVGGEGTAKDQFFGARGKRTLTCSTFTYDYDVPWIQSEANQAKFRVELFKLMRSKAPFELLAHVPGSGKEELRMKATLRSIRRVLKPGEADTRYYEMEIVEWRDTSMERRRGISAVHEGRNGHKLPTTHKLKAATTLASLAIEYYGSSTAWKTIAKANNLSHWGAGTPIHESKRFKVGDKVKIPVKPAAITIRKPPIIIPR